jgi:lipopolysaccharide/colanic/teichoic acid biosynthesis glycosyltransferase
MEEPPTVDWELVEDGGGAGWMYEIVKRSVDLLVSGSLLLLLSPVLLLVSLAIRLDSPGPVLFAHRRTGRLGKRFVMYKFRTMRVGADRERGEVARLSKLQPPDFKIEDDPRITRVGRYLRQWSVDEIPNVLRGDMSLVGPRPTTWGPELYEEWQLDRLSVRPGVTGLWQVMGRGDVHFDERVRLDLRYIRDRSLRLDLWIMLRTVKAVLSRRGAY